jgi:hypothetical protein
LFLLQLEHFLLGKCCFACEFLNCWSALVIKKSLPLLLVLTLLAACDKPAVQQAASATAAEQVSSKKLILQSLTNHDFGQASQLADQLALSSSANADEWLVIAEARAAADKRLDALAALEQSLVKGMNDLQRIKSSAYLATIRNSNEYTELMKRFGLVKTLVRAGDVSIEENSQTTEVRAGDVSVSLPN